jgi:hypothetical protein
MFRTRKRRSPLGTLHARFVHLSAIISPAISPKTSLAIYNRFESTARVEGDIARTDDVPDNWVHPKFCSKYSVLRVNHFFVP